MGVTVSGSLPIINEARLQAAISQAGNMAGQEIVKRARDGILSGAKSGRHYPGLPNQSSAPGEYSANQSGDLLNSINYRMSGHFLSIYATSGHAGYQEYGTSKMGARPNLKKAIEESDGMIRSIIDQCVMRALGGG